MGGHSRLMTARVAFDEVLTAALEQPVSGWDFSWAHGRVSAEPLSWSYDDLAVERLAGARRVLDIDTGGGELLADLLQRAAPVDRDVTATEGWPPDLPVATERLSPLGVSVRSAPRDVLPLDDGSVDLVLDRHGRLVADEVARVLVPGGVLLTQQVGSEDCTDLNDALGAARPRARGSWTGRVAQRALEQAGLVVEGASEEHPTTTFHDVGAVVVHLRAVPWQLPGTTVGDHREALRGLHERWDTDGPLVVRTHRFLLAARRPQPAG